MAEIRAHDAGPDDTPSGLSAMLERQRQDLHRTMRKAAEGSLQWAIPDELRPPADGADDGAAYVGTPGEFDNWTLVRHLTQFFR